MNRHPSHPSDGLGTCTSCGWQAWRIPHSGGYAPCPKCGHALAFDAEHWRGMSDESPPPYMTEKQAA
jgi:predicted RNA-binding Zn-ribbon protein involved in translation (DUF1610 family)